MISAVVLAKNSPAIEKTLLSLSWCDEIVVIDDYSSDTTLDLVKKYTHKVFQRHVNNDFSGQRNFGLEKVNGEWVLFVDSDEIVSEELKNEILNKIRNSLLDTRNPQIYGYYIPRLDFIWGRELRHGETGSIKLLRLAKKDAGRWVRPIHEVWEIKGDTELLTHPILHYPHPDVAQFLSKINTYSSINATYFYKQGKRVSYGSIILYPMGKFILNYIFKLGFLDGTAGIIMALMMSFHSFLTRGKMWELQKRTSHEERVTK